VPEVDAPRIRPGQRAQVVLAATESAAADAPVEVVLPQADAITRSFSVKIRLANEDLRFRPGNVVTALIALGASRSVLTVPPGAVQHYPDGGLYVWIVDAGHHTVTRRIVSVGRTHGAAVEVVSGLQAGEIVVTGAAAPLFDGMSVTLATP
jgi:RND family efflux transporter MFP subunit